MVNLLKDIPSVLLLGPGPSTVPEEVYRAMRLPTLGYLDFYFVRIMDGIKAMLQQLLGTRNRVTLPMSGTGMAGMETCFANILQPGDRVLVCVNGVFSKRMEDVASRLGAKVETLEFEWGTPVDPARLRERLAGGSYKAVAMVHGETSTGVVNPAAEVGAVLKGRSELYVLDTVTTLGGVPVAVDAWGVDALYSCSQKCLSCSPGLSPVSLSDRAFAAAKARPGKLHSFYLDLTQLISYWEGEKRVYHHTAPINLLYALYEGLRLIQEEGEKKVFARHEAACRRLVDGLGKLGLEPLVAQGARLPTLTAVRIPAGIDDAEVRTRLRVDHLIEIGAGLGPLAGKIWRIGLMGHAAREENVDRLLGALRKVLKR